MPSSINRRHFSALREKLLPFAALLVFAAVTLAWWGFLAWLIWHLI
jgi:hypothetical protein